MKNKSNIVIRNKKAEFDYEFLEKYTAGIVLYGTEIKSLKAGKASLNDSFCYFHRDELYLRGFHISEYTWGNIHNHKPARERKLLLNRKELNKLSKSIKEQGLTIIAYRVFISDKGFAKINIALAKGKKQYDKRESIKEKDVKRDLDRSYKL